MALAPDGTRRVGRSGRWIWPIQRRSKPRL